MVGHKYILEPYKGINTRYRCPICQQRDKTFSLYINSETREHIKPIVGRCNRENSCGYHYTPKQYFNDNNISFDTSQTEVYKSKPTITQQKAVSYIPVEVFKASLNPTVPEPNHFVKFLIDLFGIQLANELIGRYFIATSKHWNGATVFWQIDRKGKVRTGKIMLYSPVNGKRVKEPYNHIYWAHKAIKQAEFELNQCLFGEHLLIDITKPVAIVESEKMAVIASAYLPQFIWLAVGSINNLSAEKCGILKGRIVTLFPDLNGYDKWNSKMIELSHLAKFTISDLLERRATKAEKDQGLDLADFLIKLDINAFAFPKPYVKEILRAVQVVVELTPIEQTDNFMEIGAFQDEIEQSDYSEGNDLADVYIEAFKKESVVYSEPQLDEIRSQIMYSPESMELHCKRLEANPEIFNNVISIEESYKAIQYFADNDTDMYLLQKLE
jgi:hypothetical protein